MSISFGKAGGFLSPTSMSETSGFKKMIYDALSKMRDICVRKILIIITNN